LVVVQFTFSVVLIAGTIIIKEQMSFMRSKQLGYDKSYVLSCSMRKMGAHYDAVKADLLKQPGIAGVTSASVNIYDMAAIPAITGGMENKMEKP
jgi:putative ABC transport system permease protein